MTKPIHAAVAPQLPPRSVDFNALHDACLAGAEAAAKFAADLIAPPKPAEQPAAPAPAATPAPKNDVA